MYADSFSEPDVILAEDIPSCLDDLSPSEKIEYFVKGIVDNAIDLVRFRCDDETRDAVAANEREIWTAMNALQFVASSIIGEREEREKAAKKPPTLILVK